MGTAPPNVGVANKLELDLERVELAGRRTVSDLGSPSDRKQCRAIAFLYMVRPVCCASESTVDRKRISFNAAAA
jgi:hypothetical protein